MFVALLWNLALTGAAAIFLAAAGRLPFLRRRPALRHCLWLLLLVKLVTPPLVDVPLLPAAGDADRSAVVAVLPERSAEPEEFSLELPETVTPVLADTASAVVDEKVGEDAGGAASLAPRGGLSPYVGVLFAVSLTGTCLLVIFHFVRAAKLYRWLGRAGRENELLSGCCAVVATSLGIRGAVRSRAIDMRITPLLWAWGGATLVMPCRLIDDLSAEQLRSIVAHELAHFLRRDHWTNVFVFIVKALLWWNPVVWWAERELHAAQELCCDAIAMDRAGTNRRSYAATLLKALDFIQAEPAARCVLASGMGSRASIIRRFEMIGEKRLSYKLSRWTLLLLTVLLIPLVCMPVRGQEKKTAELPARDEDKKADTAEAEMAKSDNCDNDEPIDTKTLELGRAVKKRITTYSDEETLVLKDGQAGLMKIKKNVTPVAELLITPHVVENGTKFDLEAFDATGKAIEGSKTTSYAIHEAQSSRMGLGKTFTVDGKPILSKIQLVPKRRDDGSVAVEVKVLFTPIPTAEETEAMLLADGKEGRLQLNFQKISLWIMQHKASTGRYPKDLAELNKPLPKDVYSPHGEDFHYEVLSGKIILSSCGKDGVYGNDDDEILIVGEGGMTSNQRHRLYPLEEEGKKEAEKINPQDERVMGIRPRGNCSISGRVVSAETGEPLERAKMYLFDQNTFGAIFIDAAADGTFKFKDIPTGPFSMQLINTAGYQDVFYNPEGKPGYQFVPFSLKDGEQRSDIVINAERACQVSGKIVDEQGKVPKNINSLGVWAWFEKDNGSNGYRSKSTHVNQADGSYAIDGLSGKPVYVMALDWQATKKDDAYPPIYYPNTFSRSEAKQIFFDTKRSVDNINITLKKEGGVILEGTVTDRETNKPIAKTLVTVHHVDMLFDRVTAYTDEKGKYRICCLGPGEFSVHVDASPWGYVRTRKLLTLNDAKENNRLDFTVTPGVSIQGKFVDEHGKEKQIYHKCYGLAFAEGYPTPESNSWSGVDNKYAISDAFRQSRITFNPDEGDYEEEYMIFPTRSSFVIPALLPGNTMIRFLPKQEGQKVVNILYNGRDVLESGIDLKTGQDVKDVAITIGNE